MKIQINDEILTGNLGDGWASQEDAAHALADYQDRTWREELAAVEADGHEIEIGIDVERADGCSREWSVVVDPDLYSDDECDVALDLEQRVRALLTDPQRLWEQWCQSDESAEFVA